MYTIGVIGENGYIGSYIYDNLIKNNFCVKSLDYRHKNINASEFEELDIIIYTGGITTRNLCDNLNIENINNKNIDDILLLASYLTEKHLLIYMSTAAIYEGYGNIPASESMRVLVDNHDIYSKSIYQRELALSTVKCRTVGLRTGMTCGISRCQRYDLAFMNMVLNSFKNNKITITQHDTARSFLGLKDLYRSIETIILNNTTLTGSTIFNICSFNSTINEIANFISSELKSKISIIETNKIQNNIGFSMNNQLFSNRFNFTFNDTKESILAEFIQNKSIFERFTNECRICKGSNLYLILNLGNQPLVNNLLLTQNAEAEIFPLNIYNCNNCYHTQLGCTISPLKMFNYYTYVSGVSNSALEHFKMITDYLISISKYRHKVLELASNDGSQLDFFKSAGFETYGVDPAKNICEIALKKGHTIICDYWDDKDFSNVLPSSFDIIVAQNVVAHVPDPIKFVKKCSNYMTDDTILYIQTSQAEMYIHNEFDTIYHEHMSFFTLESFKYLAETSNLFICDTNKFPIHGTSYGITLKKRTNNQIHCAKFFVLLQDEISAGMYKPSFYYQYRSNIIKFKYDILNVLEEYRKNYMIVGYGAAAKGITMLNYINFKHIEYIVDDCELKYGKFTPGLNIPIVNKNVLQNDMRNLLIIILPWNIKDELIQKIQTLVQGRSVRILIPFPKINTAILNG
jgi:nucleoside-diphosphate-sugar epimerase